MRRLAERLGIVIDEDRWPGLVAEARFGRMRERAAKLTPQGTMPGLWPDPSRFFNRGASGQWQTFLGSEDLDRYWARVHRLTSSDLAAWTHGGRQATTRWDRRAPVSPPRPPRPRL